MQRICSAIVIFLMIMPCVTYADLETEAQSRTVRRHKIKFKGYINGSYNYLVSSPYFTSNVYDRLNDIAENGARLQQAYFSVSTRQEGFGAYINSVTGLDAYGLAPLGWNANMFQLKNVGLVVPEAFFQYRHKTFTVKAGELAALAGLESYVYVYNTNFSRSLLDDFAQPGSHVSVRAVERLHESLGLIFGLCNGWSTIRSPGRLNMVEAGVSFTPSKALMLNVNGIIGPQYLSDALIRGRTSTRRLLDIYGTYHITEPLSIAWNIDYGRQTTALLPSGVQGGAVWAGVAGYLNYQFNDRWRSSLRGEIFNDGDGYRTGVRQGLKELTLTVGYSPYGYLDLMAETRHDFSNVHSFINGNRLGRNPYQQSFALEALLHFT